MSVKVSDHDKIFKRGGGLEYTFCNAISTCSAFVFFVGCWVSLWPASLTLEKLTFCPVFTRQVRRRTLQTAIWMWSSETPSSEISLLSSSFKTLSLCALEDSLTINHSHLQIIFLRNLFLSFWKRETSHKPITCQLEVTWRFAGLRGQGWYSDRAQNPSLGCPRVQTGTEPRTNSKRACASHDVSTKVKGSRLIIQI